MVGRFDHNFLTNHSLAKTRGSWWETVLQFSVDAGRCLFPSRHLPAIFPPSVRVTSDFPCYAAPAFESEWIGRRKKQVINLFNFNPFQWVADRLSEASHGVTTQLQPLVGLIMATPLNFTTQNAIVHQAWGLMVIVADIMLGLFVVIAAIQIMYGQVVGTLQMPAGQLVTRALLTAILIHLSAFLGETLLNLNNLLCGLVLGNVQDFIALFANGQLNTGQLILLTIIITIVFGISLFRMIFQAVKRIIRFNVLFVLSGPAFLCSFSSLTSSIFSIWLRMYISTIFEQFIQFLTFGLGFQFILASKQTGLIGFILAVAMLNMTAEVPELLARFSASGGGKDPVGNLINSAIKVGIMLA